MTTAFECTGSLEQLETVQDCEHHHDYVSGEGDALVARCVSITDTASDSTFFDLQFLQPVIIFTFFLLLFTNTFYVACSRLILFTILTFAVHPDAGVVLVVGRVAVGTVDYSLIFLALFRCVFTFTFSSALVTHEATC